MIIEIGMQSGTRNCIDNLLYSIDMYPLFSLSIIIILVLSVTIIPILYCISRSLPPVPTMKDKEE